jgi:hypothetical protein
MIIRQLMSLSLFTLSAAAFAAERPKLVVGIVIDQFRYDYLTRFQADYHGGLDMLLKNGADFTNARYLQSPTVTAVGHSIFLSGAMPSISGIISNSWYDRQSKKQVTSVCDWAYQVVGRGRLVEGPRCTDEDPASPKRLLVSTVGDELRNVSENSKVVGISLKARAAILPSGHRANGAFWFDSNTGNFITSTYYMDQLPKWAQDFNSKKLPAAYINKNWPGFPSWDFHSGPGSPEQYQKIPASPWGNELIEKFTEAAIEGEQLGQRGPTDLITVSFSSNDYVGHAVGPDAPEVRDMAIRVDALIGQLFAAIETKVGLKNVVVVLTADHGVSPAPDVNTKRKMPGTYVFADPGDIVETALDRHFGDGDWVESAGETDVYLNWATLDKFRGTNGQKADLQEVYNVAKLALLDTKQLHAVRVYDRSQLENGIAGDQVARSFVYGYFPRESGDLVIALEPYAVLGSESGHGTGHFSPHGYDRHVPILFMGPGIKPGHYNANIAPNDIAPTLATVLAIETPSGSSGRVLSEMLTN